MAGLNIRKLRKFLRSFSVEFLFSERKKSGQESGAGVYLLPVDSQEKDLSFRPSQKRVEKSLKLSKGIPRLPLGMTKRIFGFQRFLIHKFRNLNFKNFRPLLAGVLIIILLIQILTPSGQSLLGATYTFTQTNWGGGVSGTTAAHPGNDSGWTAYSVVSSTLKFANSNADLQIATSTNYITSTDDGTSNTGFNRSGFSHSQTNVANSGSAASVQLAPASASAGGTGADGSITVNSAKNINTDSLSGQNRIGPSIISLASASGVGSIFGINTSIALDSSGYPRIGYSNVNGAYNYAMYIQCTNADCSSVASATMGTVGSLASSVRMVLGADNFARFVYSTRSGSYNYSTIARCGDAACVSKNGIRNFGQYGGGSNSIAVDNSGFIKIGLQQGYSGNQFTYSNCSNIDCSMTNGGWTLPDIGTGNFNSLAKSSVDGFIRMIYFDQNQYLRFLVCTNADCSLSASTTVIAQNMVSNTSTSQLVMAADGFGRFSYSLGGNLTFVRCNNSLCSSQTTGVVGSNAGASSLAMGTDGFPRIAYYDKVNRDLKYVICADEDCASYSSYTLDANGDVGGSPALAIGSDGNPRIAYHDATNNQLKFLTYKAAGDAPSYSVTSLTANTATLAQSPGAAIAAGDAVLLINLQGTATNQGNVGNYEFLTVQSVSNNVVTFTGNKTKYYGTATSTNDLNLGTAATNQRVILQRVPQYKNVTVQNGGSLTANAWNGVSGGVLAFMATGTVDVQSGGNISMTGKGYRGPQAGGTGGYQGESYNGLGVQYVYANYGGGGGSGYDAPLCGYDGYAGMGGGYGSEGVPYGGVGGRLYGVTDLSTMFLGSAGGSSEASGSSGGGIIFIEAGNISNNGNIYNSGNNGIAGIAPSGGAAGGSVYLKGGSINIGSGLLSASGGTGGTSLWGGDQDCGASPNGGDGGVGRIYIQSNNISGTSAPTYNSGALLTTYYTTGTYTSGIIDIGLGVQAWRNLSYGTTLNGQTITVKVRSSNDSGMSGAPAFSSCTNIASGGSLASGGCVTNGDRYIQYEASLSTSDNTVTPSLNDVTISYDIYNTSASIVSNVFDSGDSTNVMGSINWDEDTSLPSNTTVTVSVRTANNSALTGASAWQPFTNASSGCSKSVSAVSCPNSALPTVIKDGTDDRYFQYKITLTSDGSNTPTFSESRIQFVINAPPEVRNVTATQNADGSVTINYEVRSVDTTTDTNSVGFITPAFQYCQGGTSCSSISGLSANATSSKSVNLDGVTWDSYSVTWYPGVDRPNIYDGTAKIRVVADDLQAANNYAYGTSSAFVLDTMPPTSPVLKVDAAVSPAQVTVGATDNLAIQYKISNNSNLSGASWAALSTPTTSASLTLSSNPATVYAQYIDAVSNTTTIYSVTTPDTATSVIIQDVSNITSVPAEYRLFIAWKAVNTPGPGFQAYQVYRSEDNVNWTMIYSLSDRLINYYMDSTPVQNQLYYYRIVTVDSSGNRSFPSTSVSARANAAPDPGEGGGGQVPAPIISNVATSTITASSIIISWDTDILANSTVAYSASPGQFTNDVTVASMVDNAANLGAHQVIVAGLIPNTTYYFQVRSSNVNGVEATDSNGGTGYIFTTTQGPVVSSGPAVKEATNNTVTIRWGTDIPANSTVFYSTSSDFAISNSVSDLSNFVTNHELTLTGLATSTKYFYYIRSVDGSGNVVIDQNVVNGVAQYYACYTTNDTSVPTFLGFNVTVNTTTAAVTWKTNKAADSQIEYGTTIAYGSNSTYDSTLTVQHYILLTDLTPNTLYHYRARSRDVNNNLGISGDMTFTTANAADMTAPILSNIATSSVSLTQATVTWDTNKNTNGTVLYGTDPGLGYLAGNVEDYSGTSHSVTVRNLSGNTTYYFRVNSSDSYGNSSTSTVYTFITAADVTAPVISGVTKLVNQTAAFVNWTTNELANGTVEYGVNTSYGSFSYATSSYDTNHSILLSSLQPSTTYYYRVTSADPSGNSATDDNGGSGYTLTTLAVPDTVPPVISSLNVSSIARDRATVSWNTDKYTNATVDFGPTLGYGHLMGNLYDFSSTAHSVNLTDLINNTTYYFRANSIDSLGNAASSTGTFTTSPDVSPPVISSTSTLANSTAAFVNWQTDELTYSAVNYGLDVFSLSTQVAVTSTLNTNHSLPLTGLTPSTTYFYNIVASDPSANTTTIGPYSFETPAFGVQTIIIDNTKPNIIIDNTQPKDITAPNISNVQITDLTTFGATVNWTTDEEGNSLVKYGVSDRYGSLAGDESIKTTQHSVPLVNLNPATTYHFKVVTFDSAGNIASSADTFFTTLNVDGTEAKPNETATDAEEQQKALDQLLMQRIKSAPAKVILGMIDALSKNPFLTGLSDDAAVATFSNVVSQIGQAPLIVGLRPTVEVKGNMATIKWSTDKKTTGMVNFAREQDYLAGSDKPYTTSIVDGDNLNTSHTVELTSLESASRYHFQVVSKGEIGPEGRSKDYTFETEAVKPTVSDMKVTDIKATSVIVSWKSNVPTASTLEYTNVSTTKSLTSGDPALLITHVFTLQNLTPGTKYSLVIKAKNETGEETPSSAIFFETTIDKDPASIQNIIANSTLYPGVTSKVQTIISWDTNEPSQCGLSYQEGVQDNPDHVKHTEPETSYAEKHFVVLTAFKPGSVYKYWVQCLDESENKSESEKFTTLTPTEKQTIIDIISNNFQQVFGWTKNLGI